MSKRLPRIAGIVVGGVVGTIVGLGAMIDVVGCATPDFQCDTHMECRSGDLDGVCEATGYCSFPDPECASERRYGSHAPSRYANLCVADELADASGGLTGNDGSEPTSGASSSATTGVTSSASTTSVLTDGSTDAGESQADADATTSTLDPDLVAWYRLDQAPPGGVVPDASGNGIHGSCGEANCFATTEGPRGVAGQFDGIDDHVRIPNHGLLHTTAELTVSLWLRLDSFPAAGQYMHAIDKPYGEESRNSWEIRIDRPSAESPPRFGFGSFDGMSGNSVLVPVPFDEGTWTHVVARWDGATLELFVDDGLVAAEPLGGLAFDGNDLLIGADRDNGFTQWFWDGALSDIRIYARALTDAELAGL